MKTERLSIRVTRERDLELSAFSKKFGISKSLIISKCIDFALPKIKPIPEFSDSPQKTKEGR